MIHLALANTSPLKEYVSLARDRNVKTRRVVSRALADLFFSNPRQFYILEEELWKTGVPLSRWTVADAWGFIGKKEPKKAFRRLREIAEADDNWEVIEGVGTSLVVIGRKYPELLLNEMEKWSSSGLERVGRTSIEALRGIAKKEPSKVIPFLEKLKDDRSLYVRKAVAHILREMCKKDPDLVIELCRKWMNTSKEANYVIKHGLKKLKGVREADEILRGLK